ncbi:hypothetical protein ScPMuIL_002973 [Solemya velum]
MNRRSATKNLEMVNQNEHDDHFERSTITNSDVDENIERGNWSKKIEFVLSCLSYAVGLGNVWRFPYVCYRNGAGAFLIPFIIMLFVTGIPLVFMELSFGQYASAGIVSVWKAVPIFQGVGWAMFIVSLLIAIYYNMIIAYTLYYLFASFAKKLPWSECGSWSTSACSKSNIENCLKAENVWCNGTCIGASEVDNQNSNFCTNRSQQSSLISASDEFFHQNVLSISPGIHAVGEVKWELALCLLLSWVLVCICLAKGIKSSGKAVYFTAFFPYLVLSILLIRGLTLPGSVNGISYFLTPQWDKLGDLEVWRDAAVQIFFSLSPCWGGLITLASYNKFHNNCLKDAVLVSVLDCLTSIFAGLVIFSIVGYMAEELQEPIETVAREGAGLAFILYPELVTKLPISQLWSMLFFAMLVTLGIGTQIATVTTMTTTLSDYFPHVWRRGNRQSYLLVGISVFCYLIGLSFCTEGGMYVLQLFDNYAATYSLLVIGLVECLALAWVYGADNFLTDIECMLGKKPHCIWKLSWCFIAPLALLVILIFTFTNFKPTQYGSYLFPAWADWIGLGITLISILAIPFTAIVKIIMEHRISNGSVWQHVKDLSRPAGDWGPALKQHREMRMFPYSVSLKDSKLPLALLPPEYQEINPNPLPEIGYVPVVETLEDLQRNGS